MSFGGRLFRRYFRLTAEQRNAEDLAAELRMKPPLTIVVRTYTDRTVAIGVHLDTSMCLKPDDEELTR